MEKCQCTSCKSDGHLTGHGHSKKCTYGAIYEATVEDTGKKIKLCSPCSASDYWFYKKLNLERVK